MQARRRYTLTLPGGRTLALGDRTLVMGVLNVTPDSFSDGGAYENTMRAVEAALRMADAGADILDVGGESTRPGGRPVSAEDELGRVLPVVEALASRLTLPVSVDTYKAAVADAALLAGAAIVNDVSGLRHDPALGEVVARHGAGLVLMHMRGRSADMYLEASYHDLVGEVLDELRDSIAFAVGAGIPRERLVIDPGLGFAKDARQSFEALAGLDAFAELGLPLLVGPSRKSFLTHVLPEPVAPAQRDWATAAAVTAAVLSGAHVVRVHAVGPMVQVVRVADEIRRYHQTHDS